MTDTTDAVTEALSVIDKALAQMLRRELVSSGEVTDVLLDVRTLLTLPVTAISSVLGMNVIVNSDTDFVLAPILILVMAAISGVLLLWTKRRGWW